MNSRNFGGPSPNNRNSLLGRRIAARAIDLAILIGIAKLLFRESDLVSALAIGMVGSIYFALLEAQSPRNATLGKRIMGLQVRSLTDAPLTFARTFLRWCFIPLIVAFPPLALPLGGYFLWAANTSSDQQFPYDRWARVGVFQVTKSSEGSMEKNQAEDRANRKQKSDGPERAGWEKGKEFEKREKKHHLTGFEPTPRDIFEAPPDTFNSPDFRKNDADKYN